MEYICALLVLGCAFLLSFLASESASARAARDARIAANPLAPANLAKGAPPRNARSNKQAEAARKEQLLRTVEGEPDVVAETLKQWIQE